MTQQRRSVHTIRRAEGRHPTTKPDSITPELFVHDGPAALEFYKRAFGAVERSRLMSMDGRKLVNGHIEIRGHRLFVCDEFSADEGGTCRCPHTLGGTGVRIMLEVDNADQAVEQAVAAGANVMIPLADMFLGRPLRKTDRSLRS